jgi:hypothetical protein
VHLTLYKGARNPVPEDQADFDSWRECADAIKDIVADVVTVSDAITDPEERMAAAKLRMLAIGPYRLSKPKRANENVVEISMIVLDVDHVERLDALLANVDALGEPALVYASPSDTPEARRVRVIAPLDEPIAPERCAVTRFWLAERLGLAHGCGVERAHEPSRIFFAGRLEGTPPRDVWEFGI